MPALAAVAGALTLAFACTSARAGAATRQASAFDLTVSSPLAVIATIERREPGAGRIDTFRAQVTDTIAGTVPDALRVVSERAFPSDPPALAEGRGYLLFLGEVPTQSLWRAFRSDARARHLADSTHALALDPVIAPAVARALRDFARAVKDDPTDARRLDQLAAHLASGPELLRREAAIGLAARPSPLRPWLDDAKLGPLGRWLGDAGGDPALQAAVVRAFTEGRATRAAATLLTAGQSNAALRSSVLGFYTRLVGDDGDVRTSALEALAEWRTSTDPETRAAVMELAARLGGAESVGFLADAAIADTSDDAAVAAVGALAELGRDESRAELVYAGLGRIAREARDRPAARAIEALALTGTARGVTEITSVFGHHRPELEIVAVMALLNANHPDAFAAIRRVRDAPDTDPRVRQAIEKLTGSRG